MKSITLICQECGKTKTFIGEIVADIIKAIDASGWHDGPQHTDFCPECDKALTDAYYGEAYE